MNFFLKKFFIAYNNGKFRSRRKKDIRNLFRLKKEQNYTEIKDIKNFLRQEKETKAIKEGILRYIKQILSTKEKEIIINQ